MDRLSSLWLQKSLVTLMIWELREHFLFKQDSSTQHYQFFMARGCRVHYRMSSGISSLYLTGASSTLPPVWQQKTFRDGQMSLRQYGPQLRTTGSQSSSVQKYSDRFSTKHKVAGGCQELETLTADVEAQAHFIHTQSVIKWVQGSTSQCWPQSASLTGPENPGKGKEQNQVSPFTLTSPGWSWYVVGYFLEIS